VASGLLSREAEEGGGGLVLVRSTVVPSGARRRPSGKREERREISVSIRFRWGKEGFDLLYVSHSVVMDYVPRLNKHF
jgi:hypothetical protein